MRRVFVALISAVSVVAFTHMVSAADLYQPAYKPLPSPPLTVADWSGVYIGLEGGYGWGKQDFNPAFNFFQEPSGIDPTFPIISSVNQSGWLGGGFAGVQKQWGSWVLGLEADIDWADINGTTTASTTNVIPCSLCTASVTTGESINSKFDEIGMAGPKIGWAFSPNWMIYAMGGLAWAHEEVNANESTSEVCSPARPCNDQHIPLSEAEAFGQSGGLSTFGYAVGGGLDYKWQLDAGSAVIFGVKYLHYGFGDNSFVLTDNTFTTARSLSFNANQSADVVTGRVSYLFSTH